MLSVHVRTILKTMNDLTYRLPQTRTIQNLPGPKSAELNGRREASVSASIKPGLPAFIVDADGGVLVDIDGNSFIDFASGIGVTTVGASNPAVVEAVSDAVQHFTHTCFMVSPYESYVAVAEKLAKVTPGDHAKKSALFNSGAEAVENAVKISRAYTKKDAVVVFDHAFHGRTNLTMAMTAKSTPYKSGFGPFASDVYRAPMSYPLHDGLDGPTAAARAITMMEQEIGATNIACMVIEPIQGEGGFITPAPGFLPALRAWCTDNNVVFVADEIQSGFCRSGDMFACNNENVVPDLVTLAKGIAGGMPLSAVTGRADIMDAPMPGALGGTYGGNPVACAAALASIAEMERLDLAARAREIEAIIRKELQGLVTNGVALELRGRGAMMSLELPSAKIASAAAARCKEQGVVALTCGIGGNVIRLLPPLVIPENLLRDGLRVLVEALS